LFHGVYAVGHDALSPRGTLYAGLLAAGSGAALSHRTAAALWKFTSSMPAVLARLAAAGVAPTRSELERRFRKLARKAGLPEPLVAHRIGPYRVDFFWPSHNLVVETDGLRYHGHVRAVPRDHGKDAGLQLRGCTVLRFTWWDVVYTPSAVADRIARFLSRPAMRRAS
jgi:very-short-patch-repair endonuclease